MPNDHLFDKFSPTAREVMLKAQKFAKASFSGIDTEHLLLGLIDTPNTIAYGILQSYLITIEQIRLILNLQHFRTQIVRGLSDDLKRLLTLSFKIAASYHHHQIESDHLLLAIVRDQNNNAYKILLKLNIDPREIKLEIESIFSDLKGMDNVMGLSPSAELNKIPLPSQEKHPSEKITKSSRPGPLEYFTTDLTELAKKDKLDPVIGRHQEIDRLVQILSRRTKNNPVLLGDPGVGKTAIVEGLAQRIIDLNAPPQLTDKKILMLDLTLLIAGTMYRGQFEERMKKLMDVITQNPDYILFIDELHTIVGAGSAEGSMDVANILKPVLTKGQIRLIGATTREEYRKFIEKDAALERRLQTIDVQEPTAEETLSILKGLRSRYEQFHHLKITDEALIKAVNLSGRYLMEKFWPDKAIDLIDEAAAAVNLTPLNREKSQKTILEQQLNQIIAQKNLAIEKEKYDQANTLREQEKKKSASWEKAQTKNSKENLKTLTGEDIARTVTTITNIPLDHLLVDEKITYLDLAKKLNQKIVGQKEAIKAISLAIRRSKSGIANPHRPIGSFMFLGPTGVGKTELAKVLAETLFGQKESIIKIDMSEFMEKHNVSRLVGAPPGYVGYEEAGKLTEQVRRRPYSLILFDEMEKAHHDVFNLLLQILEDGYLTDAHGKRVNFRNTILIMTSNIGIAELSRQAAIGFVAQNKNQKISAQTEYDRIKDRVMEEFKQQFRPEFINRLDQVIVFRPLDQEAIQKIVSLQLEELKKRLNAEKIKIKYHLQVIKHLAQKGYEPEFGARPVRRIISSEIEDPLSDGILRGDFQAGDTILISVFNNQIKLEKVSSAKSNFSQLITKR